jgi:hypothetical protein
MSTFLKAKKTLQNKFELASSKTPGSASPPEFDEFL